MNVSIKICYQAIKQLSPSTFHSWYRRRDTIHGHNTRDRDLLQHRFKTKYGESTVNHNGVKLWNYLDAGIKSSKSIHIFKRATKQYLLQKY